MRFSNNPEYFFKNIDRLPMELVDIIQSYIPISVTMFLTKTNYINNHNTIRTIINKRNIEQYIRSMVRNDYDFVFEQLLIENYTRWINMKKYYYKESIYNNYLCFLEAYAVENESSKCRTVLDNFFEEQCLSKNQHKKNIIRYIRWRT